MAAPTDSPALLDRAADALDADQPQEALNLLNDFLQRSPGHVDATVLKAEALVLLDQWEAAEELLQEAAHENKDEPAILLATADLVLDIHPDDNAAIEQACEMAERGEELARGRGDGALVVELQLIQGRALSALGELLGAVDAFERAYDSSRQSDDVLIELAMAQFEALQFDDARRNLEGLRNRHPEDARVHHYLGLLAERASQLEQAEAFFARAHELDPDEFPKPITLSEDEFAEAVENAFEQLPERVQLYLANVPIMIDPIPSDDDLHGDVPLSPLCLGMFRGHAVGELSVLDPWSQMPSSVLLFQRNLERYARSREELVEEIETTLLHEVGHFVGWDEEDLREHDLD